MCTAFGFLLPPLDARCNPACAALSSTECTRWIASACRFATLACLHARELRRFPLASVRAFAMPKSVSAMRLSTPSAASTGGSDLRSRGWRRIAHPQTVSSPKYDVSVRSPKYDNNIHNNILSSHIPLGHHITPPSRAGRIAAAAPHMSSISPHARKLLLIRCASFPLSPCPQPTPHKGLWPS